MMELSPAGRSRAGASRCTASCRAWASARSSIGSRASSRSTAGCATMLRASRSRSGRRGAHRRDDAPALRDEAPPLARVDGVEAQRCAPARGRRVRDPRKPRRARRHARSAPTARSAAIASPSCSIPPTAATAMRSSTARTADRATRSRARFPTTGRRPAWRLSRNVRRAPPSTAHPTAGASTRSRTPAPSAGRGSRCAIRAARWSTTWIRLPPRCARSRSGEIVAIKGLGGFHLACDARNAGAVARLRERKAREEKPFAVMVANAASARRCADVDAGERALLESPERPIVLLRKRDGADRRCAGIAPGLAWLGVMLPYTPLAVPALSRGRRAARGDAPGSTSRRTSCW